MNELLNQYQHVEAILRHVPVVLFTLDNTGRFGVCEGTPLQQIVPPGTPLIGQSVFDLMREYPDSVAYVRAALAGAMFTAVVEVRGRVFQTRYEPLRSANSTPCGARGIALDITERAMLEKRLAQFTQASADSGSEPRNVAAPPTLSERERAVLQRVAAGMTNRAIAADLIITPATVKWHLEQVYQKLDVHSRMAAVTQAQALGLLSAIGRRST